MTAQILKFRPRRIRCARFYALLTFAKKQEQRRRLQEARDLADPTNPVSEYLGDPMPPRGAA